MQRRFFFRDATLELDGFSSGVSKSYALDQAINNQAAAAAKPVTYYGGEIPPHELSPFKGAIGEEVSLVVNPPDSGSHTDANENWRGFLTHFVTPPLAAQHLRGGFLSVGLKGIHASSTSSLTVEFSVYAVDSDGALVGSMFDRDKPATRVFVADDSSDFAIHRVGVPCKPVDIPAGGRIVIEVWARQIVTDDAGTEGVGLDLRLNGGDESLESDSPASYAEFPSPIQLADEQPVFSARIEPLRGARHHRVFATDVIQHSDGSEQRVRL